MNEKNDNINEIIREELQKEAALLEQELAKREKENEMSPELRAEIREKLHVQIEEYERERVYAQLSEADREALELGRKLQKKTTVVRRKKVRRVYVAAAALLILVLAIGMTSFGGAERIAEIVKSMVGGREVVKVNSDDDNMKIARENEEEAYQEVRDAFGIDPVKLQKYPEGMKFDFIEINQDLQTAEMIFHYKGKNVAYIISASNAETSFGVDIEDEIIDQYTMENEGQKIEIKEYQVAGMNEKKYSASFSYEGLDYFLVGGIEKEETETIAKNLYFF